MATSLDLIVEGVPGYVCGDYLPSERSERTRERYRRMLASGVVNPAAIDEPGLVLPHPDLSRWFVREAILELSGDSVLSGGAATLRDIGAGEGVPDHGRALPDVTERLRRRLSE